MGSKSLQAAIEEFQALAQAVTSAKKSRQGGACPEGFEFIQLLPEREVTEFNKEITALSLDIKSKLGGIAGVQPLLAYNLAISKLKSKLGAYELIAAALYEKDEHGS